MPRNLNWWYEEATFFICYWCIFIIFGLFILHKTKFAFIPSITYPSQERQLLVSQLEEFQGEKSALNATLDQLRAEIKDSADNYKIKERKNIQLAKDLKKQLVNEQKRCAKLQDRLQQVL